MQAAPHGSLIRPRLYERERLPGLRCRDLERRGPSLPECASLTRVLQRAAVRRIPDPAVMRGERPQRPLGGAGAVLHLSQLFRQWRARPEPQRDVHRHCS